MNEFEKIVLTGLTYQQAGQAFAEAKMPVGGRGDVVITMPIDVFNMVYSAWHESRPMNVGVF